MSGSMSDLSGRANAADLGIGVFWDATAASARPSTLQLVHSSYLLVISDHVGLAWILREQRMAFPAKRRLGVADLGRGDELFLLTTRGCYRNPTRDRTRIVGQAFVTSQVTTLDEPLELIGRTFDRACDLRLEALAPFGQGVDLLPLVESLDAFPNKKAWAMWLRRPLLSLSTSDANIVRDQVRKASDTPDLTVPGYLERIPS